MRYCKLLLIFFVSFAARADNYLSYLGGGGEPKALPVTMFDDNTKELDSFLAANKNWNYEIKFNGGHSQTDAQINSGFKEATRKEPFRKDSLKGSVETYLRGIESGKIKSGDKILVMINSHGGARSDGSDSHLITAGASEGTLNLQTLSGATGVVNLDQLKELISVANAKGIKLGIMDFSCHSGNTLALANDKTCVISAAGNDHFSYTGFASDFLKRMKPGASLEQIFLDTRLSSPDTSYPMISTPAGQEINSKFYPKLSPYLNYDSDQLKATSRTLSDYIQMAATTQTCSTDDNLADVKKQLQNLKTTVTAQNNPEAAAEVEKLATMVTDYKNKIDRKIEAIKALGAAQSKQKVTLVGNGSFKGHKQTSSNNFTVSELIEADFDKTILGVQQAYEEGVKKSADEKTKAYDDQNAQYDASLDMYSQAKKRQQELMAQFPHLKQYREKFRSIMNDMTETSFKDSSEISMQEKKIFDLWYRSKIDKEKSNACGDFVL